ncbi:SDR family oxidoreductase [Luminiphilus sp.]|jgi:NAD(P)-dependent dehydrogenase (short-subunit alcohol dehydrogenase family)|nr:SDR family oxidoreductase [Halieaceae bacterium]MDA8554467.1 SDR family oxidoreductase [Luminiphilus sp.]
MNERLKGKVAVITGAASGIGAATAKTYVEQGARVVLGDIQDLPGEALAASLGGSAHAVFRHCNVTNEAEVEALVEAAVSEFGQIDVMFNCAGIVGAVGPMSTTPADEWKLTIDIMINGVFYGMKHASRHMKEAGSGSIISMSSTAGVMGGLGPHAYTAAKHAVVGMTKNLAAEVGGFGVRVNCIAPAGMATPMVAEVITGDHHNLDDTIAALAEGSPLKGRAGLAQDVANAALWLASDESGYTSGLTLTVDAGATTGSTAEAPAFADYQPMMREAGKSGLD